LHEHLFKLVLSQPQRSLRTEFLGGEMKAILAAAAISAFALATPAFGQEAAATEGDDDVDTPTLLAYLGLTAADGKNTVGEGAGGIEGHMLASIMAIKAADDVIKSVQAGGSKTVVLLAGNETFSLAEYYQADRQLKLLEGDTKRFMQQVAVTRCLTPGSLVAPFASLDSIKTITSTPLTEKADKFDFQVSDVLGAFRTSTSFSPVSVTLGTQLFRNAILSRPDPGVVWVNPGDISQPTGGDGFIDKFISLRNDLVPFADGKCDKTDEAIKKAATALLTRVDGLTASKEGAPSLLDKAAVAATILSTHKAIKVLRVDVDKAGGTLVSTSNIFTTLGVPGITMRGGMVVTYRLTDPITGSTDKAGIIICRVPQRLLKSITSEDIGLDAVTCSPPGVPSEEEGTGRGK
jgi:hypothetical protein